jgi:hypothetical protein
MSWIDLETRDDHLVAVDFAEAPRGYPASANQNDHVPHGDVVAVASGATLGDPLSVSETAPRVRAELAGSLHFILSQYLRPSTLRRLIGPRDGMIGRVMMGRNMQGEIDDDLLARVLAQAVVEHIRQSGFVVTHRMSS